MPQPALCNVPGVQDALRDKADPQRAAHSQRFFRTGPGEYGQGDRFLGIAVPDVRAVARQCHALAIDDAVELLHSPWHEERLCALVILVDRYTRTPAERQQIYRIYLANTIHINNWDLVDVSCKDIVGRHCYDNPEQVSTLRRLAKSPSLWERRIAVISTLYFLQRGDPTPTCDIAVLLLGDQEDLIHKATGWMLREMGKRVDSGLLVDFLRVHDASMPRTALRYAIEHFDAEKRSAYLRGEF